MTGWTWQAGIGVLGGLGVFAVIFVPALIVQYRRYGRVSARRLLGLSAVSVYAVALAAYVFLPLPERNSVCSYGNIAFQKEPLAFVDDVLAQARQVGRLDALLSWTVLQVLLNVALFVPFGIIVRRYLGRGIIVATLLGFATSAFIELTQWSAIWGLYPCNFRTGDVDDLIANTAGAFFGAVIAPAVLFWMPQTDQLTPHRTSPRPVTVWRRWLGMGLDVVGYGFISWAVVASVIGLRAVSLGEVEAAPLWAELVGDLAAGLLVFGLPALRAGGGSFGQTVVWLTPTWPTGTSLLRRLARASITGGVYTASQLASALAGDGTGPWNLLSLVGLGWVLACVVAVPFTGRARGLSARLTGAEIVDVRA